jgi:short-subunit dehydrogenase
MRLKDKIVVITGGSKGLGKALAKTFVQEECKVVISSRTKAELEETASEIGAIAVCADSREEKQVAKLAEEVVKKFGKIDIWVNNAGVRIPHSKIEEINWQRAHDMFEVNFFGTAYGSSAALRQMKIQRHGMIINILSTSALEGRPNSSAYVGSKHAAKGFTESLRNEVREFGISVISVYPGGMKTDFFREQLPADIDQYMDPKSVAHKIVENIKREKPDEELFIRRPKA